jgi:hypothetical protein
MKGSTRSAAIAALVVVVGSPIANAQPRFGPNDVRSVVFVAKSENKNEVHYAISLDGRCMPARAAPVYAYWRMRERGDALVEPLLDREEAAYGVASQHVDGSVVHLSLRALAGRTITFETRSEEGRCTARAIASIAGRPARLTSVYVKIGFPIRIDHLLLQGIALDDGNVLRERVAR